MCGRYTLKTPNPRLQELFGLQDPPQLVPRFNVAPTQAVFAIRAADSATALREAVMLRWGLIPFWAKDLAIGNTMINARAETVAEKPSFRQAFLKRRCLIPADGFFRMGETCKWQETTVVDSADGRRAIRHGGTMGKLVAAA